MPKYLRYFASAFDDEIREWCRKSGAIRVNHVFDLFELEFGRCPSNGVAKLLIVFTANPESHLRSHLLLNVLDVFFFLDRGMFSQLGRAEQDRVILDSIHTCFNAFAGQYGWDQGHFENTYRKIVDGSIVFDRLWGKSVRNRKTGCSAQVRVRYDDAIDMILLVQGKDGMLLREHLLARLAPTIGSLQNAHGRLVWHNDTEIRLFRKNMKDYWTYDIASEKSDFFFERAERGDAHGQYDLGVIYLEGRLGFPDREKAVYWMRRAAEQGFTRAARRLEILEQDQRRSEP